MNTLDEIYAKHDWWEQRFRRAQERREIANKTINQCHSHLSPTKMVQQIVELLKPHFPEYKLYVLGPFGIASEVAVHANDPATNETVGSLNFRYSAGTPPLTLIDWSRNTGRYPANSIGALNQLNYPDKEVPGTIEELAHLLRASIDTE